MKIIEIHNVPTKVTPTRLQDYAVGIFHTASTKSAIKKAIKKELILVNANIAQTATFISGGEEISLLEEKSKHKYFDLKLQVLFEDDYLAIIRKPAGINVSGNSFATIDNVLEQNLKASSKKDVVKPRPVHRLDYPTSGVLLIGKTSLSIQFLNKLFEEKKIHKTYYAITIGKMTSQGKISNTINGKAAFSKFEVLEQQPSRRFEFLNLVKLSPQTGRRHQLRIHLASIGNPILGDQDYGKKGLILKGKGIYLHASILKFIHPFTNEKISISNELPKKFLKIFTQ